MTRVTGQKDEKKEKEKEEKGEEKEEKKFLPMGTHTHTDQSKVVQAKVQVLVDLKARCLFEHLPFRETQSLTRWFVARKSTANYPYDRGTGVKTYLGVAQIGNALFAKDCLLMGQEQACSRIRILVVCLVVWVSPAKNGLIHREMIVACLIVI